MQILYGGKREKSHFPNMWHICKQSCTFHVTVHVTVLSVTLFAQVFFHCNFGKTKANS